MVVHLERASRAQYDIQSVLIATLLSMAMFAAVLRRANVTNAFSRVALDTTSQHRDPIRYVEIRHSPIPPTPIVDIPATTHRVQPPMQNALPSTGVATPPAQLEHLNDTSSASVPQLQPSFRLALPTPPPKPYITLRAVRNPFSPRPMTAAERDSNLMANLAMPHSVAYERARAAELRDSLAHEAAMPGTIPGRTAGEQGRAGAAAGGGFGASVQPRSIESSASA